AANLVSERVLAVAFGSRLFVDPSNQGVQPRFPFALPPGDLWPASIKDQLDVFVLKYLWCEGGADVAFVGKPSVGEIADRGVHADGAGIEDGRPEAIPGSTNSKLPAKIIAAAEHKSRLGRSGRGVRGRDDGSCRRGVELSGAGVCAAQEGVLLRLYNLQQFDARTGGCQKINRFRWRRWFLMGGAGGLRSCRQSAGQHQPGAR